MRQMLGRRRLHHYAQDDRGLNGAVREFNSHDGPARIFYNRNSQQFFVNRYGYGDEERFGPMLDSYDIVELYRKTDGKVQVSPEELEYFEANLGSFRMF